MARRLCCAVLASVAGTPTAAEPATPTAAASRQQQSKHSEESQEKRSLPSVFPSPLQACRACVDSFPRREEPGHACHAGACNLYDPHTQPQGGVIGRGPDWKPLNKSDTCVTLDSVAWFSDCIPVVATGADSVATIARTCEYQQQVLVGPLETLETLEPEKAEQGEEPPEKAEQGEEPGKKVRQKEKQGNFPKKKIKIPPVAAFSAFPPFAPTSQPDADTRAVLAAQGPLFYDGTTFPFDSDHALLGGACDRMNRFFTCVGGGGGGARWRARWRAVWARDEAGRHALLDRARAEISLFARFCSPLFEYPTKPLFCAAYPDADPCQELEGLACDECIARGGLWCGDSQKCVGKVGQVGGEGGEVGGGVLGGGEVGGLAGVGVQQCVPKCPPAPPAAPPPASPAVSPPPASPTPTVPEMWWWRMAREEPTGALGDWRAVGVRDEPAPYFSSSVEE